MVRLNLVPRLALLREKGKSTESCIPRFSSCGNTGIQETTSQNPKAAIRSTREAQGRVVPLKPERLQVHCSSRQRTVLFRASNSQGLGSPLLPRGPIWNVHRSSAPGLFAKQCVPSGKWCKSTAFRQSCARSSKRAGGLIPRIALDQCRVPERYRTRVPFDVIDTSSP